MASLTLSQIQDSLSHYVPSDGSFIPRLNQALARLNNMGIYRDSTVQYSIPVVDGHITLPDDADSILHALVDNNPVAVHALWQDFKTIGLAANDLSWGMIDSGFCPVKRNLPVTTDTLYIVPSADSPTQSQFTTQQQRAVSILAASEDRMVKASTEDPGFDGMTLLFPEDLVRITQIRFDQLVDQFDIRTDELDPDTTIATVGPGSGVTRYRRFRIPNSIDGSTTAHVLCKRAIRPLSNPQDVTHIGNINAIKNGLMAVISEDSNDIERADAFWNKCFQLLEEEASSTRGAIRPRLSLDPYGTGGRDLVPNIM